MRAYVETERYFRLPELRTQKPAGVISVDEGECLGADERFVFVSKHFLSCSALLLKKPLSNTYGLFHMLPSQEIDRDSVPLSRFRNATAILVQGEASMPTEKILTNLNHLFEINVVRTIPIKTIKNPNDGENYRHYPFHVVFRPARNKILIARVSHQDVLPFPAFL